MLQCCIKQINLPPRSTGFHNFVKVSLTKNPKRRPTADKLLSVIGLIVVLDNIDSCLKK